MSFDYMHTHWVRDIIQLVTGHCIERSIRQLGYIWRFEALTVNKTLWNEIILECCGISELLSWRMVRHLGFGALPLGYFPLTEFVCKSKRTKTIVLLIPSWVITKCSQMQVFINVL